MSESGEKRSDDAMHFFFLFDLSCFFFCSKLPDPRIISNFSKLPVTISEHDFLPGNFFVRFQIKLFSKNIFAIILAAMV